ncbi:MAG TPA: hypothetical protein VIV11_00990, partial [Kofleriaceae bacterium]
MRWLALVALLGGCDIIFDLDRVPEPPGPLPIVGRWFSATAGAGHTCALDLDGRLFCWGLNEQGQVGRESTRYVLEDVGQVGDKLWNHISTSYDHTCGIQADESLWCWGSNTFGELGDYKPPAIAPRQVAGIWRDVSAGLDHTCGIRSDDHSLWCWGRGDSGQIGDGTTSLLIASTRIGM